MTAEAPAIGVAVESDKARWRNRLRTASSARSRS